MCGCVNASVSEVIYEFGYVNVSVGEDKIEFCQEG